MLPDWLYDILSTKYSVNRCGIIVKYKDYSELPKSSYKREYENTASSRFGRQKRLIANATHALSTESVNRPIIFTITTPIPADEKLSNTEISRFFNNCSKPHSWGKFENYLWVREYQKNGRPHWHVIADTKKFPVKQLSVKWSKRFGTEHCNSIRLNPPKNRYLRNDSRAAWYLTKYFTKENFEKLDNAISNTKRIRKFAISQELRAQSEPEILCRNFDSGRLKVLLASKTEKKINEEVSIFVPKAWQDRKKRKIVA